MIIGIGGISRAGKGTLSKLIADRYRKTGLRVCILHQDQYVQAEHAIPKVRDRTDWEVPASVDFHSFRRAILEAQNGSEYDHIIAEGLLSFYDPALLGLYDKKIYIEITWTTFLRRKRMDLRWGKKSDPAWYLNHIWDSHWTYGLPKLDDSYLEISGDWFFDMELVMGFVEA